VRETSDRRREIDLGDAQIEKAFRGAEKPINPIPSDADNETRPNDCRCQITIVKRPIRAVRGHEVAAIGGQRKSGPTQATMLRNTRQTGANRLCRKVQLPSCLLEKLINLAVRLGGSSSFSLSATTSLFLGPVARHVTGSPWNNEVPLAFLSKMVRAAEEGPKGKAMTSPDDGR
jgi:hypothetical protein